MMDVEKFGRKVSCGFRKWSMSVGDYNAVHVFADNHPLYLSLTLEDVTPEQLENLASMFSDAAKKMRQ